MTQDFLGHPFLLHLPMVSCTSTEFLPASCAPCWRGHVFYCLSKQSHRMLCRLQVFSGMSFLLAKIYYHLSKIKTELNMTLWVVRTKTDLFKERQKKTHWPQVQPWEQQAAPRTHIRSQHQQMIFVGDGNFPCFCVISRDSWYYTAAPALLPLEHCWNNHLITHSNETVFYYKQNSFYITKKPGSIQFWKSYPCRNHLEINLHFQWRGE